MVEFRVKKVIYKLGNNYLSKIYTHKIRFLKMCACVCECVVAEYVIVAEYVKS